ncbi:MAG TPA: hypothetical protein VI279_13200 [Rhodocyclaceae bacterium]
MPLQNFPAPKRQHGFVILLMLVLLTMGVLYFTVSALTPLAYQLKRTAATQDSLRQAKEALIAYAATYRDKNLDEVFGYLPCPDTNGNGIADISCGSKDETRIGLLPYRELGLPDLRDADGNCLWYAVSGRFKNTAKTDALNWDTQGQIEIYDLSDTAKASPLAKADDDNGGVAAVVFAPGTPLNGATRNTSTDATKPCSVGAIDTALIANYLDGGYALGTASPGVLQVVRGSSDSATNNDSIAWLTPKDIFDRVVARADFKNPSSSSPAGQINTLSDEIKYKLEKLIQDDIANASTSSLPVNLSAYSQHGVGELPSLSTLTQSNSSPLKTGYDNYFTNWAEQYRYARCNTASNTCLTVGADACRGGLFFASRGDNDIPRKSTDKWPTPFSAGDLAGHAAKYFEDALSLITGGATTFSGNSSYSDSGTAASRAKDVGTCLFPGTFVSFAQDIGSFSTGNVNSAGGGNPVASVSTTNKTVSLGSSVSGSGTARSGCVWFPTALPMATLLRAYFRYQVVTRGRGFTFALADASTNDPTSTSPIMCGASTNTRLGYAGAPPTGQVTDGVTTLNIASVSYSAGSATITTVGSHGFSWGTTVTVSGVLPSGYNGTYAINSVPSSTQFRYALASNPGNSPAGIKPPKLAIEFDTASNSSRVDPSSDHFAFVYWGNASDSSPSDTGNDDNTHYTGIAGSPAEPLNPRDTSVTSAIATPVATLSAASWSGGTVTATTLGTHNYSTGQYVSIADIAGTSFGGTYAVTATDSSHFSYPLASDPGTYIYGSRATRSVPVSGASWSGGTATFTTSQNHGLTTGNYVSITGVNPVGYNGVYAVTSTPSSTQLTVAITSSPGSYSSGGAVTATHKISAASWSGGTVTVTTASTHNLTVGQYVAIGNIYPASYDGMFATVALGVSGAEWSAGTATVATAAPHGFTTGQTVTLSGVSPSGYNGSFTVASVTDTTHFTYSLVADPGGSGSGGQAAEPHHFYYSQSGNPGSSFTGSQFAQPGIVTASTLNPDYLSGSGSTVPINTATVPYNDSGMAVAKDGVIHVRLDIARSYNASSRQATLSMKAYIADTFDTLSGNTCSVDDYKNLSRNLSDLCTQPIYIEQAGIPITDVYSATSAAAMASVYLGFTNSRSTGSSDNQDVEISNLLVRSQ